MARYLIEVNEAKEVVSKIVSDSLVQGGMNPEKFSSQVARWCHDHANEKFHDTQSERIIPLMSIMLTAWSTALLESKAICHYRKPQPSYRDVLENEYLPTIKSFLVEARNLAIDEKRGQQAKGDTGKDSDVPIDIKIPPHYTQDC